MEFLARLADKKQLILAQMRDTWKDGRSGIEERKKQNVKQ